MKKPIKLVWNAYNYRSVGQGLRVFNIFDHYSFMESVRKLLKKPMSKEEFSEMLRREVLYYYWSKAEWELVITDTQPHIDSKELNRLITDCYLKRTVAEPPLLSAMSTCRMRKRLMYTSRFDLTGTSLSTMFGVSRNPQPKGNTSKSSIATAFTVLR